MLNKVEVKLDLGENGSKEIKINFKPKKIIVDSDFILDTTWDPRDLNDYPVPGYLKYCIKKFKISAADLSKKSGINLDRLSEFIEDTELATVQEFDSLVQVFDEIVPEPNLDAVSLSSVIVRRSGIKLKASKKLRRYLKGFLIYDFLRKDAIEWVSWHIPINSLGLSGELVAKLAEIHVYDTNDFDSNYINELSLEAEEGFSVEEINQIQKVYELPKIKGGGLHLNLDIDLIYFKERADEKLPEEIISQLAIADITKIKHLCDTPKSALCALEGLSDNDIFKIRKILEYAGYTLAEEEDQKR